MPIAQGVDGPDVKVELLIALAQNRTRLPGTTRPRLNVSLESQRPFFDQDSVMRLRAMNYYLDLEFELRNF